MKKNRKVWNTYIELIINNDKNSITNCFYNDI